MIEVPSDGELTIREETLPTGEGTKPVCVLRLSGDVELVTVPELRPRLLAALDGDAFAAVVVDLTQVRFLDSAGLALFVDARRRSRGDDERHPFPLALVAASGQPLRAIQLAGLGAALPTGATVKEALAVAGIGSIANTVQAPREG